MSSLNWKQSANDEAQATLTARDEKRLLARSKNDSGTGLGKVLRLNGGHVKKSNRENTMIK